MPNLRIEKKRFDDLMKKQYTFERLDELGFQFGIQIQKQQQKDKDGNVTIRYKFQCMNNRPDLLTENSLTRIFRIYMGQEQTPLITLSKPKTKMIIDQSVKGVRDFVVCAVLRDVTFDDKSLKAFLDTQEKLHQTFCRERKYASIGTHDLDTLTSPFLYIAKKPEDFRLVPLFHQKEVNGHGMMELLEVHKLKQYLHLIKDFPKYPVVQDANGIVGSVPPIINSQHSKLRKQTKNIFIQVTALSKNKAMVCLNTLIWGFSQYCGTKFQVQPVQIIDGQQKFLTPEISPKIFTAYHKNAQTMIGAKITQHQILTYLQRSGLKGEIIDQQTYKVIVPFWRADILHECDIIEDISICYGFKKIIPKLPKSATVGQRVRLNKFSDFLRHEMAQAQFNEVLNFALCSKADITSNLLNEDQTKLIKIQNARTKQFQTGRTTLIPGLLKTILENKSNPLPYRLFQSGDCIIIDNTTDTGAKNIKKLAAILTDQVLPNSKVSLFAQSHGSLDLVLKKCNLKFEKDYKFEVSNHQQYFKGQQFEVIVRGQSVGSIGVLHPNILSKYLWTHPVVVWELSVEKLEYYYSQSFK